MSSSLNYKSQRNFLRLCGVAPLLVGLTACGLGTVDGGSTGVAAGEDGGACFANDTCNDGLVCNASQICRPVGADPCTGVTCSGHGSCAVAGSPAVAACECDTDFYAAGLICLANEVAPVCATALTVDSSYGGYDPQALDDGVVDALGATNTTWASNDVAGAEHWVELEFPHAIAIGAVELFWAWNDFKSTYATSQAVEVLYWDRDGYATAATFTRADAGEPVSSLVFAPVETTRLRIRQAGDMGPPDYKRVLWLTEIDYGPTAACLTGCGACGSYCGDGTCDGDESSASCAADCPSTTDPCVGESCSGHGACVSSGTPAAASCSCESNYHPVGLTCVVDTVDPCAAVTCVGHSSCVGGLCPCDLGWAGSGCDACASGYHLDGAACVADSPSGTIIFQDDFRSGDISKTLNGAAFWSNNSSAYQQPSATRLSDIFVLPESPSGYSVRALYAGTTNLAEDARPELRFDLGGQYPELWVSFRLYIPQNYFHRIPIGSGNNKFLIMWNDVYSSSQYFDLEVWPRGSGDGSDKVSFNSKYNGVAQGHVFPSQDWTLGAPDDRGRWHTYVLHFKLATSAIANDGAMQVWKNGVLVMNFENLPHYTPGANYFANGYVFGASNSGFTEDTELRLDDVVFATTPLP